MSAVWSNLVVATYDVDKNLLSRFLPAKTQLLDYDGKYLLSIVAFIFSEPCFRGYKIPFFKPFPEINLRFYVKSLVNKEWKTGVVFIREISPSRLIGVTAKLLYHEDFITTKLTGYVNPVGGINTVSYECNIGNGLHCIAMETEAIGYRPNPGSIESFICDQYLAFTRLSEAQTLFFKVMHRPWLVFRPTFTHLAFDPCIFEVEGLTNSNIKSPVSTFMVDGSYTEISRPRLLGDS